MQSSAHKIWIIAGLVLLIIVSIAPVNATTFTITGGNGCIPVGSTTDLSVALSDIPQGLSGLNITISISDPGAATITNVTFPDWAALPTTSSLPADRFWLKMVDLQQKVNPGDLNVPVCRISVLSRKGGNSIITVTPIKVEDDSGGRYTLTSGQKNLCTGDSTAVSPPQTPQVTGTPIPTQTTYRSITSTVTTSSPVSTSPTQLPGTPPLSPVLQTQVINTPPTPAPTTVSSPNVTTGAVTLPATTTRAALPVILPLISCIVSVVVFGLIKRNEKE